MSFNPTKQKIVLNENLKPLPSDNIIIFYHGTDFDGKGSAAVAFNFYNRFVDNPNQIKFMPLSHGADAIDHTECTGKIVVIADFALDPVLMYRIDVIAKELHWIDHHKSAIDDVNTFLSENSELKPLRGLRDPSNTIGACGLTYRYYFEESIVLPVRLLSEFDVCESIYSQNNHPLMLSFQYGLKASNTEDPSCRLFQDLVSPNYNLSLFDKTCKRGEVVIDYETIQGDEYKQSFGQVVSLVIDGETLSDDVYLINRGIPSPILTQVEMMKHEFVSIFTYNVGVGYNASLYSYKRDCSEIAKRLGGGGHKRAAGFRCKQLPYVMKK